MEVSVTPTPSTGSGGEALAVVRDSLTSVSKWKLALILGAPVVLAWGVYYRTTKLSDDNSDAKIESKADTVKPQQLGKAERYLVKFHNIYPVQWNPL